MFRAIVRVAIGTALGFLSRGAAAQVPDHPIITEVFNNPTGSDGPSNRDNGNNNQEFVELYLPTSGQLRVGLNKDSLKLTLYEIEGDSNNSLRGQVNQRIDLKPFDLDTSNGTTPGAIARPSNGIVVLCWANYNSANPPTDLDGSPASRKALINGTITSPPAGVSVVVFNGNQFGGTTNFVTPLAESVIDVPNENVDGIFSNGSNVYLLVNRDDPGYVQLADALHPEQGPSDAALASGSVLGRSCLLDGFGGNDDSNFSAGAQPYAHPTGLDIDLEDILPAGGVFSVWCAQVSEAGGDGYMRRFVDVRKTTEDGVAGNEDPAADADAAYVAESQNGPFYPTPGAVVFSTNAPKLSVAQPARHTVNVLAGTTGRPGMIAANSGGNFPINVSVTPGLTSNAAAATFAASVSAAGVAGQAFALPEVAVTSPLTALNGAVASASLSFVATNAHAGDPAVLTPSGNSQIAATVLKPTRGQNAAGQAFEATVFLAVQGLGDTPGNSFLSSSLGTFATAHAGRECRDAQGHLPALLSANTDLTDFALTSGWQLSFPVLTSEYINATSPAGTADLATKVRNCAKRLSGSTTYDGSLNATQTAVKAIEIPIPETFTKNGTFSATENLFFASDVGEVANLRSGLSNVTTARTFELALLDTNATSTGIESGDADDFGIVVQVGQTRPGATVLPGQFVFLSYTGGLEGEDIDTVDVPGVNATDVILLDLDNLDDILGATTITKLFLVDAAGFGTLNPIEALSLAALYGDLSVTPETDFVTTGNVGGPFTPGSTTYTLTNSGNASLTWSADAGVDYVTVSPAGGTLAVGGSTSVTVSTNAATNLLAAGTYTPTLAVTNTANGAGSTERGISITVVGAVCLGDADQDQDVDLSDLGIVLSNYNRCEGSPGYDSRADLNNSGCVDLSDLGIILSAFGLPCP